MSRPDTTFLTYRGGAALASALPGPVRDALRRTASRSAARLSAERRFMVQRHLRRVLGHELHDRERDRLVRAAFDAYARYWVDSAVLQHVSDAEVDNGFSVEGFEHIEDAFDRGVGPILALPHLGGWEWAGRWLTCRPGYEVTVVVEPLDPPELFEWMADVRRSYGMNVVPLGPDAAATIVRALKDRHVVCLLCDRDIGGGGIGVDFFGERTTVPAGPATIALRTGAAVIPVGVYQLPGRRHHAVVRPAVDATRQGRLRDDVERVTQRIVAELELLIRARPEQWHLMHPNWPSDELAIAEFRAEAEADAGRSGPDPSATNGRRLGLRRSRAGGASCASA